jgi:putative transcriptional regulator
MELAWRLGVSRQTVNGIELEKQAPNLALAFKISFVFGRRIEEVFERPAVTEVDSIPRPLGLSVAV